MSKALLPHEKSFSMSGTFLCQRANPDATAAVGKLSVPANVSTEQMKVLSDNEKLMDDLGANVTPAIYYMSKENTLQQAVGLPDQKMLNIIMGNK